MLLYFRLVCLWLRTACFIATVIFTYLTEYIPYVDYIVSIYGNLLIYYRFVLDFQKYHCFHRLGDCSL
jgi:hypothetical protein